jgi:Arc/MetJ-type ribon-helix-helix transcriptional regulator
MKGGRVVRLSVVLTAEQRNFVEGRRRAYGNLSGVLRRAIDLLRREEMVEEMRAHFRGEPVRRRRTAVERLSIAALKRLPAY